MPSILFSRISPHSLKFVPAEYLFIAFFGTHYFIMIIVFMQVKQDTNLELFTNKFSPIFLAKYGGEL